MEILLGILEAVVGAVVAVVVAIALLLVLVRLADKYTKFFWKSPEGANRVDAVEKAITYAMSVVKANYSNPSREEEEALADHMNAYFLAHHIRIVVKYWEAGVFAVEYGHGMPVPANV